MHPALRKVLAREYPWPYPKPYPWPDKQKAHDLFAERQWREYLSRFRSDDLLSGFVEIAPAIADEDYWRLLRDLWVHDDCVYKRLRTWRKLFRSPRAARKCVMDENERKQLAQFPDQVRVFRGFRVEGGQDGLSWTLDYATAVRFARGEAIMLGDRYLSEHIPFPRAYIACAKIPRDRLVAYFDDETQVRESEVIVSSFRGYVRRVACTPGGTESPAGVSV